MRLFIPIICVISLFPLVYSFNPFEGLFNYGMYHLFGIGVPRDNINYYLYKHGNPHEAVPVDRNHPGIVTEDSLARTVFIIHGWQEGKENRWYAHLKDAYLARNDSRYQVVEVDWAKPAGQIYPISRGNTKEAGDRIGYFLVELSVFHSLPLESVELTGHSLGAHVAGFAGKKVYEMKGTRLRRITRLDPAGPLFMGFGEDQHLAPSDAQTVVVVHTDAGVLGYQGTLGTVDIYPNGGYAMQPGCLTFGVNPVTCNHERSYQFFEEAVRTNKMKAIKCYNYGAYLLGLCGRKRELNLGGDIYPNQTGSYYLTTNNKPPYTIIV